MSPYRRNVLVGITVVSALIILGWMIVQFGGNLGSMFAGEKIHVTFRADRADGISIGSVIKYQGLPVGVVKTVGFGESDIVVIAGEVEKYSPPPANVIGEIKMPNLLGANAVINLELTDATPSKVRLSGGEIIQTRYVGSGIIPPEITDLATTIKQSVKEFQDAGVVGHFNQLVVNFNDQATKLGQTIEHVNSVIGDDAVKSDIKLAIAQFKDTSERASRVATNLEQITGDLKGLPEKANVVMDDVQGAVTDARKTIVNADEKISVTADRINSNLEQISTVLADVKSITAKIDSGEGTAGQLINDPRLYATLVDATELLAATIKDIQRVVQQIEQEGVAIKLR